MEVIIKMTDEQLFLNYASVENNLNRVGGARSFAAHVARAGRTLANPSAQDLTTWALTPKSDGKGKGNIPDVKAFEGAKAVCALGVRAGYTDATANAAIQATERPSYSVESLATVLADPQRTGREKDKQLLLNYASVEKDTNRVGGARSFAAHVTMAGRTLANPSAQDLATWALTPKSKGVSKGNIPDAAAFEGAKAVCALGVRAGYTDATANAAIQAQVHPASKSRFANSAMSEQSGASWSQGAHAARSLGEGSSRPRQSVDPIREDAALAESLRVPSSEIGVSSRTLGKRYAESQPEGQPSSRRSASSVIGSLGVSRLKFSSENFTEEYEQSTLASVRESLTLLDDPTNRHLGVARIRGILSQPEQQNPLTQLMETRRFSVLDMQRIGLCVDDVTLVAIQEHQNLKDQLQDYMPQFIQSQQVGRYAPPPGPPPGWVPPAQDGEASLSSAALEAQSFSGAVPLRRYAPDALPPPGTSHRGGFGSR